MQCLGKKRMPRFCWLRRVTQVGWVTEGKALTLLSMG